MEDIYTAWGIAMHRIWRVPWRTHNNMFPYLAGMIDIEIVVCQKVYQIYMYVYGI